MRMPMSLLSSIALVCIASGCMSMVPESSFLNVTVAPTEQREEAPQEPTIVPEADVQPRNTTPVNIDTTPYVPRPNLLDCTFYEVRKGQTDHPTAEDLQPPRPTCSDRCRAQDSP